MGNVIKYTTTPVNNSIKKGNFALGINDIDYGPTNITGFYSTTIPSTSGYTVYNENGGTLSYESVSGTTPLINYLSNKRGVLMTTDGESLSWAAGQSNIFVTNREYENIVTSGMVLNLDAGFVSSYPTSATTWYDLSYSGNNGTLTNGPTFSSLSGGSIVFDGTNDYVLINRPSEITTGGSITVSLWAKWTTVGTTTSTIQALVDNNHSGSPIQGFIIQDRPDLNKSLQFGVQPNTNGSISTFQVGNGTWKHITGTYVTGSNRLYIDGSFNASTTAEPSMSTVQPYISLGYWQFTPSRYLNGNIANFQIYNRALSPFEVYQNYNSTKGRFGVPDIVTSGLTLNLDAGNPYSYNPLNTGSTTWTDISGNGKNGTLTNGAYYSGGTIVFDGTNDYVSLSTSGLISGWSALTYNVWVNVSQNPSYIFPGFISTYTTAVALNTSVGSWETGRGLWYEVDTVNGNYESGSPGLNTFSLNTWFNVCMVYDGTNVYAYYNNSLDKQFSASGVLKTISDIRIGNTFQYGFLNGKIAVAQIYNRALSASEVQQNFNALRGRYGI
jgi:hypothetical protein